MSEETKLKIKKNLHTVRKTTNVRFRAITALAACAALVISVVSVADKLPRQGSLATTEAITATTTAATYSASTAAEYSENAGVGPDTTMSENITYTLMPTSETDAGIASDTAFRLTTNDASLTAETLQKMVSLSDGGGFDVTQSADGAFTIKANEHFASNSIVNIGLTSNENQLLKTWVFQTESTLSITSTIPTHESAGTPLNGGIELNFSGYVEETMENYFIISPETAGHFEYYGKTAVFIPDEDLLPATVYTVTVKAGVPSKTGESLEEDYSFTFKTPYSDDYVDTPWLRTGISESFLPGDPVLIELYAARSYTGQNAEIVLYDLKNIETYRKLAESVASATHPDLSRQGETHCDTQGLTVYDTYELALQRSVNDSYGPAFLVFPESLPNGWYLAEVTFADGAALHKFIQVSPISVYMLTVADSAAVWVNSAVTGTAVASAQVALDIGPGIYETVTDSSGVALLEEIATDNSYALLNVGSQFTEIVSLRKNYNGTQTASDRFIMTYTDREAYLPTDTVKLWGSIYDAQGASDGFDLTVEIGNSKAPEAIYPVSTNKNGTFSLEIPFKNHQSGYVEYRIIESGETIYSSHLYIINYDKPIYTLKATTEKEYYRNGETPTATVTAAYFDGTPAENLKISYYPIGRRVDQSTDANGETTFTLETRDFLGTWYPRYQSEYFVTLGAEDVSVYAYANYYYFPTDYMLTIDELENGSLKLSSNAIDYSKFDPNSLDADTLRGDVSNASGTVSVYRCTCEKEQIGETYDFINKVKVPQYEYEYVETTVLERTFTTDAGIYITPTFEVEDDPEVWYRYTITYTNPDGVTCEATHHLNNLNRYTSTEPDLSYGDNGVVTVGYGEAFTLPVTNEDGKLMDRATLLNIVTTDEVVKYTVCEGNSYTDTMTKELIPNVHVTGAYFDGTRVYDISTVELCLSADSLALDVALTADGTDYKPGDTVTASLSVTDQSGNPVSDAEYVVSVTDEAAFAVRPQDYSAIDTLYAARYYPTPMIYTSYRVHSFSSKMYAEGGGEGGSEGVRSEFVDNAAFLTGTTGTDGTAQVEFTLPDNLTAWRLTAVAATGAGEVPLAGSTTTSVNAKLPYFINPVINDAYVYGDDVVVSLRASGALADGTSEYTVTVTKTDSDAEPIKATGTSQDSNFTYLNFGKLEKGTYSILIEANNGDSRDAILEQFTVRASSYEISKKEAIDLSKPLSIDASRYPVTLICYDTELKSYYDMLLSLYTQSGARADQKLAHAKAADLLSELDPEYFIPVVDELDIQSYGGLSLTSYSDEDPLLTAKALIAASEYVDKTYAVCYLNSVLCDKEATKAEVYAAYMGLAACREPVLSEIRYILRTDKTNDPELVYLYTALALLGDTETAETWLRKNYTADISLTEDIAALYGDFTLLTLIIGMEESDELLHTLLDFDSTTYLPVFEQMYYINANKPAADRSVTLTVNTNAGNTTYDLGSRATVITLNDTENVSFSVKGGAATATALYIGSAEEFSDVIDTEATVTKTYDPVEASTGDTVRVTVHVKLDESYLQENKAFTLYDAVPSGMRFIKTEYNYGGGWWLTGNEDNQLTFGIAPNRYNRWLSDEQKALNEFTIVYYVRCALQGEFVAEPAILQNLATGAVKLSDGKAVTIK